MVSNAFFYSFSTIAQTLAGAIALLGAFVLYRLQAIRAQVEDDSLRISLLYGSSAEAADLAASEAIQSLHRQTKHREVLEFVSRTPIPAGVYRADTERARLGVNLELQQKLLRTFAVSLFLTVGLITVSVGALAAAPAIIERPLGLVVLRVAIAWFIVCILSYAVLIRQALR
jgi:hypothetical protein